MGTLFHISFYGIDRTNSYAAAEAAFRRVAMLDEIMSDYRADSELMRLCEHPVGEPVPVSAELFDVLAKAQQFAQLSSGAFDVPICPSLRLWRLSRKRKSLPTPEEIVQARQAVGYNKLRLDSRNRTVTLLAPNMRLDLGGIAKGYAADQALQLLKCKGYKRALVAASGDIAIGEAPPGEPGWKIAVSLPGTTTNKTASTVLLRHAGISTSGDTEQVVELGGVRYSHIVNPTTGLGLTNPIQVTVISTNATTTDALATAVSVLGTPRGLALVESFPKTAALILEGQGLQAQASFSRKFKKLAAETPKNP